MATYDWSTWEEEGTKDTTATVDDIVKAMEEQRQEAWDNYYENPKNYDTMREILDKMGM